MKIAAPEGLTTARVAILADRFHLTMDAMGSLTDRTIHTVYFHKRSKEGAIEVPMPEVAGEPEAETLDTVLRDLLMLKNYGLQEDEFQRLRAEVVAKYGEVVENDRGHSG